MKASRPSVATCSPSALRDVNAQHLTLAGGPIQSERFDQVVHSASADSLHVGLAHRRHQSPLSSLAGFQQAREEAAIAYSRHFQLGRAHSGIPIAIAVAIALALSSG